MVALVKAGAGHALPGAAHPSAAWLSPWTGSLGRLSDSFLLAVLIYWGWDCALSVNEETKDAARTPGRAAVMSTIMLVAIFAVISVAALAYAGPAFLSPPGSSGTASPTASAMTLSADAADPGRGPSGGRGPGRRAGRRKIAVLEAACRVIAERGADATRFADVAAESGVPVSTLQYYFGSREDLLVAAFRHASSTEIAALETEVAGIDDPWNQLETILTRSLTGDPDITAASAVRSVMATLRELLRN
ncbi:MAG TPA: TetR family transcriptional regulator [Streptosporangiaceae bacterium]|nr:TetR family transcriptional regulator [Streptosporangiaceae bacterium]